MSSPNVNYDSLLTAAGSSSINSTSDRRVKYEELLRGLALDNRVHYSSDNSKLLNIFRINNDGFFSHFTYLRIFHYAQSNMNLTIGNLPKGFFKLKDMYNECFKYTVKDIDSFMDICLFLQKEGAFLNLKGTISTINGEDFIMLGPSGYYYLNYLKTNPYYLALVAIDTPIADQATADRIAGLYQRSLNTVDFQRNRRFIDIAKVFAQYLAETEAEELIALKNANCPNMDNPMFQIGDGIKSTLHETENE
ncbi:hypothetical protein QF049_004519 [Paenibacillus sp. W4I10]|uniref:hypothetical protein n=1 Tax=Paenibacillus sp. W4I10 TaxID=3042298 RepID=UPI00277EA889|nr:hypothetical protein [Paenibacillus sp. W4I10]MDQ0723258.1 hypothetical protein [Paenibacillus sp. W4I10]